MAGYRCLTQHALTGQWLAHSLEPSDLEVTWELNGPGSLTSRLTPRLPGFDPHSVDPGTTAIYLERDGLLRWGGIIWRCETDGDAYRIEAAGWTSYLHRRHDLDGELGGRGPYVHADPCQIIRDTWAYAQSTPDGNLGISVDQTTAPGTVGTPAEPWHSRWWETPVLGETVDSLVAEAGSCDYTDTAQWHPTKHEPLRRVQLGYPRLGARRTDIAFTSGINIINTSQITKSADDYAQVVITTGSGEGRSQRRVIDAVRNGRLRLEAVLDLPDVRATDALAKRAAAERTWRSALGAVEEITVRNHPAAPVGSWQVGDDVRVTIHSVWTTFSGWCRITAWTLHPDTSGGETAVIKLAPAESFHHGGAA